MGVIKVDGFDNRFKLWLSGGKKEITVDVGEFTVDPRKQDGILIQMGDLEPWYHLKYTDLVLLIRLAEEVRNCEHDWLDVRNEIVKSGEMCRKCRRVRGGNAATD